MVTESKNSQTLTEVSFNCKKINTSKHILDRLVRSTNAILLHEHWLFDCQLTTLKEINECYVGTGKAVDPTDPIMPVHMPRGYGDIGIFWKKDIDHLVTVALGGSNHIQGVTIRAEKQILLVSIYMPCKGVTDNFEAFSYCLDQVSEIILKYGNTHKIILGGDFNEDLGHGSTRPSNILSDIM